MALQVLGGGGAGERWALVLAHVARLGGRRGVCDGTPVRQPPHLREECAALARRRAAVQRLVALCPDMNVRRTFSGHPGRIADLHRHQWCEHGGVPQAQPLSGWAAFARRHAKW